MTVLSGQKKSHHTINGKRLTCKSDDNLRKFFWPEIICNVTYANSQVTNLINVTSFTEVQLFLAFIVLPGNQFARRQSFPFFFCFVVVVARVFEDVLSVYLDRNELWNIRAATVKQRKVSYLLRTLALAKHYLKSAAIVGSGRFRPIFLSSHVGPSSRVTFAVICFADGCC